jgi:hypothetical protein
LPATFWVVIGYFVLYSSSKTNGGIGIFGQALAIWIFVIASSIIVAAAYVTLANICPIGALFRAMHPARR